MIGMSQKSKNCLTEDTLHMLAHGECTPTDLHQCEEHVDGCERCRDLLESRSLDVTWHESCLPALHSHNCPSDHGSEFTGEYDQEGYPHRGHEDSMKQAALELLGPTDDPEMLGRIGNYEVVGLIGSGGMGVVFKAFDSALNRYVAIKMMQPHLAVSGAARQRFSREGRAAAAVIDDCVLPIHAVAEWQGVPYLVMQYSSGLNLQRRLEMEGPLKLNEILRVAMQTARGLAAAHAQGLVHRDVKPSNILFDGSVERAHLTDFGLARAVDDASVTRTGLLAGTPQYMSPEQVRGERVDARSDLFSLGATLYAMCTGRSPFRGDSTYSVLHRLTHDQPRPIQEINPEIPGWLCAVIDKLLSKAPDQRFQSAEELSVLLEKCLAHVQQPTEARLPAEIRTLPEACDRPRFPGWIKWIAWAVPIGGLLFAGVLIVLESGKGTIRIESDADNIPIRITQGEQVIKQLTITRSGAAVRVNAGNYQIELENINDASIHVLGGSVRLQRSETEIVRITQSALDESNPEQRTYPGSEWDVAPISASETRVFVAGDRESSMAALKSNVKNLQRGEGLSPEIESTITVDLTGDAGIDWLFSESPLKREPLGYPFCLNNVECRNGGTSSWPLIDSENRRMVLRARMECAEASDAFWNRILGVSIGIHISKTDFDLINDGQDITKVIYLPQDPANPEVLQSMASSEEGADLDILEEASKLGQPVISFRLEPVVSYSEESGSILKSYSIGDAISDARFVDLSPRNALSPVADSVNARIEDEADRLVSQIEKDYGPNAVSFDPNTMSLIIDHDLTGQQRIAEYLRVRGIANQPLINLTITGVSSEWMDDEHAEKFEHWQDSAAPLTKDEVAQIHSWHTELSKLYYHDGTFIPGKPESFQIEAFTATMIARHVPARVGDFARIQVRLDLSDALSNRISLLGTVATDGTGLVLRQPESDNFFWLITSDAEKSATMDNN
ncbi:MAG: serine/threonine protein kinase [Planctomycetales bacterium]|nr:serine/threonine protein kinase [Planctomycetales bacterium]